MKVSLVVTTAGKSQGQTIPITLTQFVIGRDPQCNLRPASALISKRHCAVLQKNGRVYAHDFNSTNGTFINDEPLKGEKPLENGDILKIGPLTFRVAIEGSVAVNKPTPIPAKAGAGDDENVAAMLLSLQDDTDAGSSGLATDDVPGGSTVMDMIAIPGVNKPEEKTDEHNKAKPGEPKKEDAAAKTKKQQANTSLAAEAILKKYSRRGRS